MAEEIRVKNTRGMFTYVEVPDRLTKQEVILIILLEQYIFCIGIYTGVLYELLVPKHSLS